MHTSPLRAVGGSISVTPPRQMLRILGLAAGALVAVTLEDRRLVLSPTRPRYTLPDQLAGRTWAGLLGLRQRFANDLGMLARNANERLCCT